METGVSRQKCLNLCGDCVQPSNKLKLCSFTEKKFQFYNRTVITLEITSHKLLLKWFLM